MLAWYTIYRFITRVDFCREHWFFKKMTKIFVAFFQKNQNFEKKKFKNPTYLSSPNCLLSSIPYQYNPFSQPKSSYGAKKSKNVKKRHFTPIFAPKVPHIMFFRKNVTRVFALSQKVSGGLAKFQRDLTYSFRELDFFCKKRIKGKCSFEPTGPPSPVSTERQSRMRRPPSCHCGPAN